MLAQARQQACTWPGARARAAIVSITVVAHRGSSPTIERTLSRVALPSGSRSTS